MKHATKLGFNYSTTICNVCHMVDTKRSEYTSGVDWCDDCYSVEQGFIYLVDTLDNLDICENGNLYNDDFEHIGCLL